MKKLDKLIIKAFIGPFVATFFITLFVLVMQFFWLYIDDLVGKGLDFFTIARLIGYVSATLVPLAFPLGMLLASIMTFGNLGETFELVAIKSAGIPLLRFMRSLFVVALFICGIAFLFNNYIIPVANLRMKTLLTNIRFSKPAFDLKEGVFYDGIPGYTLKVGKKDKEGKNLENVIIYEHSYQLQDNIIVAQRGSMSVSADKRKLLFDLQNGWRYQERGSSGNNYNTEYIRLGFKNYQKVFDLSALAMLNYNDSAFKNFYQMLSVRQLGITIDSLHKDLDTFERKSEKDVSLFFNFGKLTAKDWDSVKTKKITSLKKIQDIVPDSVRTAVFSQTQSQLTSIKNSIEGKVNEYVEKKKQLQLHLIEWHRKFSLSTACLVLFLIGAPLGSIIRKGGIGLPFVFALIFFIFFHLINTFGEKLAKQEVFNALSGMWLSTFILIPIGIFLTYKAMHDSQLFNKEYYYRLSGKIKPYVLRLIQIIKRKKSNSLVA
ncbi:MAG: LptF/LptG family permease [Sphingobacteriales bacterium]|nr:LptF/LptG family permease [Sphingobacteriales bacterium]